MAATVYKDYFQIDENYFPCVNESAINAGLKWDEFYPMCYCRAQAAKYKKAPGDKSPGALFL